MLRNFWDALATRLTKLPENRVHQRSEDFSSEAYLIAIAVYSRAKHVGLLHRGSKDRPVFIAHLCSHKVLQNAPASFARFALWIDSGLDEDQREQVASKCREVGRTSVGLAFPYAFSSPRGFFDERLEFIYGSGKLGLTCATFVLALLDSVGINVIDYDSWPIRPGDAKWQEYIMHALQMPADHIDHIRAEKIKTPRYKPCEVAGAMAAGNFPVSFSRARRFGQMLRREMIRAKREASRTQMS